MEQPHQIAYVYQECQILLARLDAVDRLAVLALLGLKFLQQYLADARFYSGCLETERQPPGAVPPR